MFSTRWCANAQIVTGYQTYPHIDQRQTAERAARALLRVMRGEAKPTAAWGNAPMLPHVMAQGTHQFPNKDLQALCAAWEATGRALAASLFVGFPHADVAEAGLSAVVITDNNPADAQAMVDELLSRAWNARREFMFDIEPLEASVARAKELGRARAVPVVLLDHYDNCASGGTMDTTDTLREIIRQDLDDVVFFGIYDPDAVRAGGRGRRRRDRHAVDRREAADAAASGGQFAADGDRNGADDLVGPFPAEGRVDARPANLHGAAPSCWTPARCRSCCCPVTSSRPRRRCCKCWASIRRSKQFVAIKSRVHWRADLGKIAREIVECAGVGVCTSDYGQLKFRKVRRPVFPLDPELKWNQPA